MPIQSMDFCIHKTESSIERNDKIGVKTHSMGGAGRGGEEKGPLRGSFFPGPRASLSPAPMGFAWG